MSFDPSDAQAWEDSGHDPLRYVVLMADRQLMPAFRVYAAPEDVDLPLEWEPLGSEVQKDPDVSPWRHHDPDHRLHPWH